MINMKIKVMIKTKMKIKRKMEMYDNSKKIYMNGIETKMKIYDDK